MESADPAADSVRSRIFEEMSDAILIADDDRRYVDVNEAACTLLGRSRAELLASRVDDVLPAEMDIAGGWEKFLAAGSSRGELTIMRGTERIIVDYRSRARLAPNRHMSVLRDVTERARAVEAAEERERAFRRLADHLPHVVSRFDRQHRHIFVNKTVERVLGRSPESFLGKTNAELGMPAENVRHWAATLDRALAGETVTTEFTFVDGDGVARTFESHVIPERDATGAIESAISVVLEVTTERAALAERREAALAAEKARAILDALLMAAPVGFGYLDRELRFQLINPTLAALNGPTVQEHLGHTPMELLPDVAAEFVRTNSEAVFATGEPLANLELEAETPAAPGIRRTFVEHWFPVRVDQQVIGIGLVVDDVTERRRAEKQLREAAVLRERLMAIVSHDLRNPLSAITMAAGIIGMNTDAPRAVVNLASRILASSHRMSRLIEQLIDFVRVDQASGLAIERAPMDLAAAAQRTIEECGLAFPEASVELVSEGSTVGNWDEDRIVQVLSNLIGNAIQHGGGAVHVRVIGREPGTVRVEVENAGTPIPPELLAVIFDPFRRASGGYARRAGLGLGLFISKSILDAHDGSIAVRSDERGTVFELVLPRH